MWRKVLASAAVLVAALDQSAVGFCVLSRVLSYLCAGRPMVIALDDWNPVARMVSTVGAGEVVRPGDTSRSFRRWLARSGTRIGAFNRAYAEQLFDLDTVAGKFVQILKRALADLPAPRLSPLLSSS